jgi:hypothetical protein
MSASVNCWRSSKTFSHCISQNMAMVKIKFSIYKWFSTVLRNIERRVNILTWILNIRNRRRWLLIFVLSPFCTGGEFVSITHSAGRWSKNPPGMCMGNQNFYLGSASTPMSLSEHLTRWKSRLYICHEVLPVRWRHWNEMRNMETYIRASSCLLISWFIYTFVLCGKEIKFCSVSHTSWSYKLRFVLFRHTPNQTVFQKIL